MKFIILSTLTFLFTKQHSTYAWNYEPVCEQNTTDDQTGLDSVECTAVPGDWGDWHDWQGDATGSYYACGAYMRFEPSQGDGDDTAGNGLKLIFCNANNWDKDQEEVVINNGYWGDWHPQQGTVKEGHCPRGHFINGVHIRYEGSQGGGDDTTLNGLKIHCQKPSDGASEEWKTIYEGIWGDWQKNPLLVTDKYVKLARMRTEEKQGGGDDTAWNGLKLRLYEFKSLPNTEVEGSWEPINSGPNLEYTLEESIKLTSGEEMSSTEKDTISLSIKSGFEFLGGSGSVEVSGEHSKEVYLAVKSTIEKQTTETHKLSCDQQQTSLRKDSSLGVMWQWQMAQDHGLNQPGFCLRSKHFRCTSKMSEKPLCPLGFCADSRCQTCEEPFCEPNCPSPEPSDVSSDDSIFEDPLIVGIVIACICIAALIILVVLWKCCCTQSKKIVIAL